MLNSGKKSRDKKIKYSNSCVVRKFFSERNKKPYSRSSASCHYLRIARMSFFCFQVNIYIYNESIKYDNQR